MHIFKDATGKQWEISINVTAVKRCRAKVNVDLYDLLDEKLGNLSKLMGDPVSFVDVLYVLCEDQAVKESVSDEDFGRLMYGDTISAATDAFVEELIDFFPEPKARQSLRKVMAAGRKMGNQLLEHAEQMANKIDPELEAEKLMNSLTKRQESLASTPDHSLSEVFS